MSSPLPLHSTLGALYVGVMVANLLYGISIVQAYYYFKHQNDKLHVILLVTAVIVSETIHQALISHAVYTWTISDWGIVDALGQLVSTAAIENFFNALTALFVQSFLTGRVWRLSHGNILLTALLILFVLAEFVITFVFTILELQFDTLAQVVTLKPLSLAINVITAVGDVLIAVALCALLHRSRTGFQRSDTVINKLIAFAVNTGLLTSVCALASFISYIAAPSTFIYIGFYFCIGRLYANALLATLNSRKMIGNSGNNTTSDKVTLSLRDMPKMGTSSKQHGATNIAIKINTTKEYVTDFIRDQEQDDKIEYLQTDSANAAAGFEGKSEGE